MIGGVPVELGTRSGMRTSGLHTSCARTRVTFPTTRASRRSDGPTQNGFPRRQPARRRSGDPASGPSSASGAAGRQALQRPPVERVRNATRPLPRHETPASVNRGTAPVVATRCSPIRRSTVVACAELEPNALGATQQARKQNEERWREVGARKSRVALEPFAGKSGEPPLIESLHRCHAPFCGDFLPSRPL